MKKIEQKTTNLQPQTDVLKTFMLILFLSRSTF